MGWSLGYDETHKRDIGYGVPAICDQPGCDEKIDRGLSYVCGGEPYGGDEGCGLYFCTAHKSFHREIEDEDGDLDWGQDVCERCAKDEPHFPCKPDAPEWVAHKMTDPSWAEWRAENPEFVETNTQSPQGVSGAGKA